MSLTPVEGDAAVGAGVEAERVAELFERAAVGGAGRVQGVDAGLVRAFGEGGEREAVAAVGVCRAGAGDLLELPAYYRGSFSI